MLVNLAVALTSLWILNASVRLQSSADEKPPVPYVDVGACPFEGCFYGVWTSNNAITTRKERSTTAPIAYKLQRGERVTALTGVVVTIKPGKVLFREPIDLATDSGPIHVRPEDPLFLLTYRGEGFTKAWFKGKIYDNVDGMSFFNGLCERDPNRCIGRIVERTVSEWWVQIRNRGGQLGWTKDTDKFDGKDSLGK